MTPPPEAVLIRLVRRAAGLTVDAASERAGISKARWTQVETGREKRKDGYHRAVAPPGTLARMAQAVRIPPARLAGEGERPDAAEVLTEILRDHERDAPPASDRPRFPDDPALDAIAATIWEIGGEDLDDDVLMGFLKLARQQRDRRASAPPARRATG